MNDPLYGAERKYWDSVPPRPPSPQLVRLWKRIDREANTRGLALEVANVETPRGRQVAVAKRRSA